MLRASIDLGTNTCLLLIAKTDPATGKVLRIVHDQSTIVRLGKGVDQAKRLDPEAMERTLACLLKYAERVKEEGKAEKNIKPNNTICVATSQARDATNSEGFFEKVKNETGFSFKIISGQDEAKWSFLGALLPEMDPTQWRVIDIGGGSTEYISNINGQVSGQSLDIGSVRFTERYLKSDPVQESEFKECLHFIDEALKPLKLNQPNIRLLAVAGTATTLASWKLGSDHFDRDEIDKIHLKREDLHQMVNELKIKTIEQRIKIAGIDSGRADVLLAGAMILWRTMVKLNFSDCRVSTRGLRFGLLGS